MENNDKTGRSFRDMLAGLFGRQSINTVVNTNTIVEKLQTPGTFSVYELNTLKARGGDTNTPSLETLKKEMLSISTSVSKHIEDNKSYQAMVPEIGKARTILIPSILSPSDMYGETITVGLNCPKLDDTITAAISTILTDHVNEKLKLGKLLSTWIGEALFDTGSTPVMILPRKAISILINENKEKGIPGTEGASESVILPTYSYDVTCENLLLVDDKSLDVELTSTDVKISTEELTGIIASQLDENKTVQSIATEAVCTNVVNDSFTKIKETLNITLDYRKIATAGDQVARANKSVINKLNGLISTYGSEKVYMVTDVDTPCENEEPLLHKLPAASVVPIHVPGDPSSHIGYFVIIDAYGNPIDADYRKMTEQRTVGAPFLASMDTIMAKDINSSQKKYNALSMVFEMTLKQTIGAALKTIGVNSFMLSDSKQIYSCIFNRALQKEKVTMVYVPPSHMAYYAYKYREDGTGKGIMEDSSFLIAMRTSFLIAKVVGALDNATDKKTISFDLESNKGTNVEQIMGVIKDAYMTKHMYNLDHNPSNVMRDIVSRNISIVPKNMAGINNLALTTETSQGQAGKNDESIEELLTNLIITGTSVPAAALNELGENEFSRSVATTNLMFSNHVRTLQNTTCDITEVIVRGVARNSHFLLTSIINILTDKQSIIKDKEEIKKYLDYVISNITVSLPTPNVTPDKARYTELDGILDTIDKVIVGLFADELVVVEDPVAKQTLVALRADIKRKMVKNAIVQLGATNMMDLDDLTDLDFSGVERINQILTNYTSGIKQLQKVSSGTTTTPVETAEPAPTEDKPSW